LKKKDSVKGKGAARKYLGNGYQLSQHEQLKKGSLQAYKEKSSGIPHRVTKNHHRLEPAVHDRSGTLILPTKGETTFSGISSESVGKALSSL